MAPIAAGGLGYEPLAVKTLAEQLTLFTLWLTDPHQAGPEYQAICAMLAAHALLHGLPCSPLFLPPARGFSQVPGEDFGETFAPTGTLRVAGDAG